MINWFAVAVICLFVLACAMDLSQQNYARALFYALSAGLNATIIFMR